MTSRLDIYVDGSRLDKGGYNRQVGYGWGAVFVETVGDGTTNIWRLSGRPAPEERLTTPQIEIRAIQSAIEAVRQRHPDGEKKPETIVIHTDQSAIVGTLSTRHQDLQHKLETSSIQLMRMPKPKKRTDTENDYIHEAHLLSREASLRDRLEKQGFLANSKGKEYRGDDAERYIQADISSVQPERIRR